MHTQRKAWCNFLRTIVIPCLIVVGIPFENAYSLERDTVMSYLASEGGQLKEIENDIYAGEDMVQDLVNKNFKGATTKSLKLGFKKVPGMINQTLLDKANELLTKVERLDVGESPDLSEHKISAEDVCTNPDAAHERAKSGKDKLKSAEKEILKKIDWLETVKERVVMVQDASAIFLEKTKPFYEWLFDLKNPFAAMWVVLELDLDPILRRIDAEANEKLRKADKILAKIEGDLRGYENTEYVAGEIAWENEILENDPCLAKEDTDHGISASLTKDSLSTLDKNSGPQLGISTALTKDSLSTLNKGHERLVQEQPQQSEIPWGRIFQGALTITNSALQGYIRGRNAQIMQNNMRQLQQQQRQQQFNNSVQRANPQPSYQPQQQQPSYGGGPSWDTICGGSSGISCAGQ